MEERRHGPERLRVYWLALDFADRCSRVAARVRWSPLSGQITRAADSGVLNISEAAGHNTPGKKLYHYRLALGSIDECSGALGRIARMNPHPACIAECQAARRDASMLCKMLLALIRRFEE